MNSGTLPYLAFTEADSGRAHESWGANCGPNALAACLGLTLDAVRAHLGNFEQRGYMNPTMMGVALESLGARRRMMSSGVPWPDANQTLDAFPARGLVRVQWGGPWLNPGVPVGAAYARTHWIASLEHQGEPWVFDVNGGWRSRRSWESEIVPLIVESIRKADGSWFPTHRWEVRP